MYKRLSPEYVAGFFDGEGCVGIYQNGQGRWHLRTQLVQKASPATLALLQQLVDEFGGNFSPTRGRVNWQLNSEKAKRFLRAILPHCQLKGPQILVALGWERGTEDEKTAQILKRLKRS